MLGDKARALDSSLGALRSQLVELQAAKAAAEGALQAAKTAAAAELKAAQDAAEAERAGAEQHAASEAAAAQAKQTALEQQLANTREVLRVTEESKGALRDKRTAALICHPADKGACSWRRCVCIRENVFFLVGKTNTEL